MITSFLKGTRYGSSLLTEQLIWIFVLKCFSMIQKETAPYDICTGGNYSLQVIIHRLLTFLFKIH